MTYWAVMVRLSLKRMASIHPPTSGSPSALPLALMPATLFALLLFALSTSPLPWTLDWAWIPALDIRLAIYVDGLAAQFLLLITGIGALVFIYAAGYLGGNPKRWRLFLLLTLFMLAMIGAVISDHLIVLFIFWELTSVLSFMLVGSTTSSKRAGNRRCRRCWSPALVGWPCSPASSCSANWPALTRYSG